MAEKIPHTDTLIAHKGYDADGLRVELKQRRIAVCIPPKSSHKLHIAFDNTLPTHCHKIENMFRR